MQNFQYHGPSTRIIFGEGSAEQLGSVARELGIRRALFVTDPAMALSPAASAARGSLQAAGLSVELFSEVVLDPTDVSVEAAAARYREVAADGIVALGGGSAMDTAKALGVLVAAGAEQIAPFYFGGSATPVGLPPLICLPTTSGTGSEVTYIAIVTDRATQRKLLVRHPLIAPTVAIVDSSLCATMPPGLTAATGFDALSHALEAMTSTMATPISDAHALDAIPRIAHYLPRAVADGSDAEARGELAYASTVAGLAFLSARLHLGHAVGHSLGAAYHLAHGLACIICMPAILEFIAEPCAAELERIGRVLGVGAHEVPAFVESLMRECRLPRLGEAIPSAPVVIPALVTHVLGEDRLINLSRRKPTPADWAAIFARSM